MSDSRPTTVRPAWIAVMLLAFGLCFTLGRSLGGPSADERSSTQQAPLTDGRLYKVPVSLSQPQRGVNEPLVMIVEWCDLRGASCRQSDAMTSALLEKYPGEVRHSWRHLPDKSSADSLEMHEFARVALEQAGRFWEVRKQLLGRPDSPIARAELAGMAQKAGMDWSAVESAMTSDRYIPYVSADEMFASRFGVEKGPTFYVNGRRLMEPVTADRLNALVAQELTHAKAVLARTKTTRELLYQEITRDGLFQPPLAVIAQTQTGTSR